MTTKTVICFLLSAMAACVIPAHAGKETASVRLGRAAKFFQVGDYEKTLQESAIVLQEDPTNITAFKQRIAVFYKTNRFTAAIRECNRMIDSNKQNTDYLLVRALLLGMLNEIDPAMKDFDNAIKINPNRLESYFFRGNFELLQGHRRNAIRDYDLTISKGKGHPAVYLGYYFRGRAEDMEGKVDAAIRDYSESIRLDPGKLPSIIANDPIFTQCMPPISTDTKLGLIERAQLLAQAGRHKESIQDFDILLTKSKKDAVLLMSRGNALYMSGQPEKAVLDYNRAMQLSPHLTDPIWNRGYALLCLRRFDKAAFDLENWLVVTYWHDDEAARVAAMCNAAYLATKQPQKGKHVIEKTLNKCQTDEWPTPLLKFANGTIRMEALLKAANDSSKQTQARTLLGVQLIASGKLKEAKEQFAWVKKSGDKKALEFPIACSLDEPVK